MSLGPILVSGGGGVTDPFQADVVFTALFQGPDATNTGIVDLTGSHSLTLSGTPLLTSATKSFGKSSLALNGSSQYMTAANSADFHTTASGFTFDGIVRRNGTPISGQFFTIAQLLDSGVTQSFAININTNGQFGVALGGSSNGDISGSTTNRGAIADTTFTHFALVHDPGVEYRFYVGGSLTSTISSATAFADGDGTLYLGASSGAFWFPGHFQALRVTQNVRYTGSSYTVPGFADYVASAFV